MTGRPRRLIVLVAINVVLVASVIALVVVLSADDGAPTRRVATSRPSTTVARATTTSTTSLPATTTTPPASATVEPLNCSWEQYLLRSAEGSANSDTIRVTLFAPAAASSTGRFVFEFTGKPAREHIVKADPSGAAHGTAKVDQAMQGNAAQVTFYSLSTNPHAPRCSYDFVVDYDGANVVT